MRGAPQRIGLEHPFDPRRAIGVWEVTDAALCASATNRRAWGDGLHHVLDARTGHAGAHDRGDVGGRADGDAGGRASRPRCSSTADPRLAHEWGVEWVRMTTDGRVEWSPGCRAELFVRTASVERDRSAEAVTVLGTLTSIWNRVFALLGRVSMYRLAFLALAALAGIAFAAVVLRARRARRRSSSS